MSLPYINRVPAGPIVEIIRGYLSSQPDLSGPERDVRYPAPFVLLAEKVDVDPATLRSYLRTDRNAETINFDLADRILCVLHKNDVWHGDLADVYESVILVDDDHVTRRAPGRVSGSKLCAREGCSNYFIPKKHSPKTGPKAQVYCSPACKHRASKMRLGLTSGDVTTKAHGKRPYYCSKGHPRGPGNSRVRPNGTVTCLVCGRERDALRRAERAAA